MQTNASERFCWRWNVLASLRPDRVRVFLQHSTPAGLHKLEQFSPTPIIILSSFLSNNYDNVSFVFHQHNYLVLWYYLSLYFIWGRLTGNMIIPINWHNRKWLVSDWNTCGKVIMTMNTTNNKWRNSLVDRRKYCIIE